MHSRPVGPWPERLPPLGCRGDLVSGTLAGTLRSVRLVSALLGPPPCSLISSRSSSLRLLAARRVRSAAFLIRCALRRVVSVPAGGWTRRRKVEPSGTRSLCGRPVSSVVPHPCGRHPAHPRERGRRLSARTREEPCRPHRRARPLGTSLQRSAASRPLTRSGRLSSGHPRRPSTCLRGRVFRSFP